MTDVSILKVLLHGQQIGTITNAPGDQSLFAFDDAYVADPQRPTLSLRFKDALGGLITDIAKTRTRVSPFFSNLLPEAPLRDYLARKAGVNAKREFQLLWALGADLPGAITVAQADGNPLPPDVADHQVAESDRLKHALRFSLAGVQLKLPAIEVAPGGLAIPQHGIGGSWIVKLASARFEMLPENEFSMMTLAAKIGMDVPDITLLALDDIVGLPDGFGGLGGSAFAVRRFDRSDAGLIHSEDFAQVFDMWPEDKYKRISYRNIANVLAAETPQDDIAEFVRRIVFNALIGNADMHAKNWSLIYPERRGARLSPAYDFISTIPYLNDTKSALTVGRTKKMYEFSLAELDYLASKARLPEKLVRNMAKETVARFHEIWATESKNLPLSKDMLSVIEAHMAKVPISAL